MASLYELSNDARKLEDLLDNLECLGDEQAVEETKNIQNIVKKLIEGKSEGIIAIVRELDLSVENIDSEIARLKELKGRKKRRIDSLKGYALDCMQSMGVKKIETNLGNMSIRKGSGKVNILDAAKIPEEYIKTEIVKKEDKKAIGKAIKDGIEVAGAELVYSDSLTLPKTIKGGGKNDQYSINEC